MKIAVLSDTHDLLRPEVMEHLRGCGAILHGGDICRPWILERLRETAPVFAVRGNNDGDWAADLPQTADLEIAGLRVCMAHRKRDLPADLRPYDLAVFGHTHVYSESRAPRDGKAPTLLLNPGSCGPRRFLQSVTMSVVTADGDGWTAERVDLALPAAAAPSGADLRRMIETVVRETGKGRGPDEIARRYGMDPALTEQIARLYLTHPGVTADGIMTKLGL